MDKFQTNSLYGLRYATSVASSKDLVKRSDLQRHANSPQFEVDVTPPLNTEYSLAYLHLNDGRDPANENQRVQLNEGKQCSYMCIEGSLKFIFENGEEQVLERYELIEILGEERYEIVGTGVLCSINSPKFDEDTYSFVEK